MTNQIPPENSPENPKLEEFREKLTRPMGFVFLLVGAIAAKFLVLDFLDNLRRTHQAAVEYDARLCMLPVFFMGLGFVMAALGQKGLKRLKTPEKKLTKAGWAVVVIMLALGLGFYLWFQGQLTELGYTDLH